MMMQKKKNRKKQSDGSFLPRPLALLLAVATVFSLTYLWLHGRCEALGTQLKDLELRKVELQKQRVNEESKLANMKSPRQIEYLLQKHNLAMVWPDERQIVRMHRAPAGLAPATAVVMAHKQPGMPRFAATMND